MGRPARGVDSDAHCCSNVGSTALLFFTGIVGSCDQRRCPAG